MADQDYPTLYEDMEESAQRTRAAAIAFEHVLGGPEADMVPVNGYPNQPTIAGRVKARLDPLVQTIESAAESVKRFAGVRPTAPTTRLDGSPLQPGDEYQNSTTNLRYSWSGSSWVVLNASVQQLTLQLASPDGSEAIGHGSSTVGKVLKALKDATDPALGSKGVGHYSPGGAGLTVADLLNAGRNIRLFGALKNDGVTNDLAVFQAAAAAGPGIIDARGLNCFIQGQVSIGEGQIWLVEGSRFKLGTYTGTTFWMYNAHDSALIGPASITGTGKASGAQKAVEVNSSKRFLVYGITAFDMPGWGFYVSGNTGVTRAEAGRVINCGGHRCYKGYEDLPGSEYMTVDNPHFTQNAEFGMKTTAGNVRLVNPQIVDNDKDGLLYFPGVNHAHGGVVGGNINHNIRYNVWASDVTNGASFVGTNFYANNSAGAGAIFLERTKGINISGGIIDCWVYVFNAVGQNVLRDMYCPGDYGPMVLSNENDKQPALLWVKDCTGAGIRRNAKNINNPGPLYTNVRRVGAVQALTVNTGNVIKFATVMRDDHAAYDAASGVFTVPATQQGLYRLKAVLVFTAPGYSLTNSYVVLRVNNADVVLQAAAGFSSNVMVFNFDYEAELNAADTVSLAGFIFATTGNFGHATYDSRMTFERIG